MITERELLDTGWEVHSYTYKKRVGAKEFTIYHLGMFRSGTLANTTINDGRNKASIKSIQDIDKFIKDNTGFKGFVKSIL